MVKTVTDPTTKKKRSFRWMKVLLLLVTLVFAMRLGDKILHYISLQEQAEAYRDQLNVAQAEYEQRLEIVELLDNQAYLERVAREKLGMVKEGETIVSLVE